MQHVLNRRDNPVTLQQNTTNRAFTIKGVGLHSGVPCQIEVTPAAPGTGRLFVVDGVEVPARACNVIETARCTTIGLGGVRIRTVEHVLAALAGCLVDNARILVEGPEIPIMDGSALPFVESILNVGTCAQLLPPNTVVVERTHTVANTNGSSSMTASTGDGFSITLDTQFNNWPEGDSSNTLELGSSSDTFIRELAPARTFAFADEVERLLSAGLARGGSLDNVIIITPPDLFSSPLRLAGEWWRHKALDVVGDLALVDARICGQIRAVRPGHTINTGLALALYENGEELRRLEP